MLKVLVLASWYPNRADASSGDFVLRHVQAVSAFAKSFVVFVMKDETMGAGTEIITKTEEQGIITYRAYYGRSSRFAFFEKVNSYKKYLNLQKIIIGQVQTEYGLPDIVHVHIAMKAGLGALFLQRKFNIPFVVTENWAGYYRYCVPSLYDKSFWYRRLNKKILKQTNLFLPVTKDLGRTVNEFFVRTAFSVVPNVVNTDLFFFTDYQPAVFRFIHASYLNFQKNPQGILQAAARLAGMGYQFELVLLGNEDKSLRELSSSLRLDKIVSIQQAVPYHQVAQAMQQSSAFVLFSRFENLPCVILEALCCGLPVVSSRVGGIAEVIDSSNGILVESEDVESLVSAMKKMIDHYGDYNRQQIAISAKDRFSYRTVGKQYYDCYKDVLRLP